MQDAMARLRAALTPKVLIALGAVLLIASLMRGDGGSVAGFTDLERRTAKALSQMKGAGAVSVVILTRGVEDSASGGIGMGAPQTHEVPVGAIAVAQGAQDPLVRMELEQALCALLGLPGAAVSVMAGGK